MVRKKNTDIVISYIIPEKCMYVKKKKKQLSNIVIVLVMTKIKSFINILPGTDDETHEVDLGVVVLGDHHLVRHLDHRGPGKIKRLKEGKREKIER